MIMGNKSYWDLLMDSAYQYPTLDEVPEEDVANICYHFCLEDRDHTRDMFIGEGPDARSLIRSDDLHQSLLHFYIHSFSPSCADTTESLKESIHNLMIDYVTPQLDFEAAKHEVHSEIAEDYHLDSWKVDRDYMDYSGQMELIGDSRCAS
jgi:hypothetical protein